jgi:hypothetical protein
MMKLIVLCSAAVLAACATSQSGSSIAPGVSDNAGLTASVETAPAVAAVETLNAADIESPMVCESVKRAASRVAERVCYSHAQYAELTAQRERNAERTLTELEQQQRRLEMSRQQSEEDQRRRMGAFAR